MKQIYDNLIKELKKHNLRLSRHRLKVLEYLCQKQNHPTADQIYIDLHKEIPNLSKTTVYNTLHMLTALGIIRAINIENNEARYDIITKSHGHFKCERCGSILDFNIDLNSIATEDLTGFKIVDKNVYFKGLCPKCLLNIDKNENI